MVQNYAFSSTVKMECLATANTNFDSSKYANLIQYANNTCQIVCYAILYIKKKLHYTKFLFSVHAVIIAYSPKLHII